MLDSDEEEERAGEKEALCKRRKNVLRNKKKKSSKSKKPREKKFKLKSPLRMISSQEIESYTFVRFVTHIFSEEEEMGK